MGAGAAPRAPSCLRSRNSFSAALDGFGHLAKAAHREAVYTSEGDRERDATQTWTGPTRDELRPARQSRAASGPGGELEDVAHRGHVRSEAGVLRDELERQALVGAPLGDSLNHGAALADAAPRGADAPDALR